MVELFQGRKLLGCVLLGLLCQQSLATEQPKRHSMLFALGLSSKLDNSVSQQLASAGYSGIERTVSGKGIGVSFGYRNFTPDRRWSSDFEYLSLGKRSTRISKIVPPAGKTTQQVLKDVANALPEHGQGLGVTTTKHIQLSPYWTMEMGAGVFVARTNREAKVGTQTFTLNDTSAKPMLMLGMRRQLRNGMGLRAVARRFFREGDDIDQISVGFTKDF
ncbi:MAG: hypothetical protein ACPG47_02005 [Leucothrix sp.]